MTEQILKQLLEGSYLIVYPTDMKLPNGMIDRNYNLSTSKFSMQDMAFITKMIDAQVIPNIYPKESKPECVTHDMMDKVIVQLDKKKAKGKKK